jgi:hypothetical protein
MSAQETDNTSASDSGSKPPSVNGAFFPWLEGDAENQKLSVKTLTRFPLMGAVGLIGSALTVLLSFGVLKAFEGHEVINSKHMPYFPKPAVWLSVIISMNGIFLHIAASRGLSIMWWFRASKEQTTVADLHNVWDRGTSPVSALTQWKTFDYVALAAVLVAAIPVNGIVLQNAVGSYVDYRDVSTPETIFAITNTLPVGFSADINHDSGRMTRYSSD